MILELLLLPVCLLTTTPNSVAAESELNISRNMGPHLIAAPSVKSSIDRAEAYAHTGDLAIAIPQLPVCKDYRGAFRAYTDVKETQIPRNLPYVTTPPRGNVTTPFRGNGAEKAHRWRHSKSRKNVDY